MKQKTNLIGYIYLLPYLIVYCVFIGIPLLSEGEPDPGMPPKTRTQPLDGPKPAAESAETIEG